MVSNTLTFITPGLREGTAAHRKFDRGEGGFTLIELLVAISLFSIVIMALTGVFISSSQSINDQRLRTAATRVATDHLETMRGLLFGQLDAAAGTTMVTTAEGRVFPVDTEVTAIDAATGLPAAGGRVRRITVSVSWRSGGAPRSVSYSTAVASDDSRPSAAAQRIATVAMAPSPTVTDAFGRPLADLDVTVVLAGFPATALVHLSWSNADGTNGAKTVTNTSGSNWEATLAKAQVLAAIRPDGSGEVGFTVSAGSAVTGYTLSVRRAASIPPVITSATISPNPVAVARPANSKNCGDNRQCENTTDVVFAVTVGNLDSADGDSVIVAYQLGDGTFQEKPLTATGGQWQLTVRQRTTRFRIGPDSPFRVTAIRSADGATATTTILRDVVST